MSRTHYHVMCSNPGCLPDSNEIFETKRAAQDQLREWRDEARESVRYDREHFPDGQNRVWGSIASGLIVHEHGYWDSQYIYELFPCTDDCDPEQEW